MKPLDDDERRLAEVTARVIAKAEEIGLPDGPGALVTPHAIQFLARAHLELREKYLDLLGSIQAGDLGAQIRSINAYVDQVTSDGIKASLRAAERQHGMDAAAPLVNDVKPAPPAFINTLPNARRAFPKPRVVPSPAEVAAPSDRDLLATYCRVMCELENVFTQHERFIVRQWDGMDGCWTDCTSAVDRDEALRVWAERTAGGTRQVSFDEIDYYRIFPGGTRMDWDGSEGREMFR